MDALVKNQCPTLSSIDFREMIFFSAHMLVSSFTSIAIHIHRRVFIRVVFIHVHIMFCPYEGESAQKNKIKSILGILE